MNNSSFFTVSMAVSTPGLSLSGINSCDELESYAELLVSVSIDFTHTISKGK